MSSNKKSTKPMHPMAKLALQRVKLIEEEKARIKAAEEEEERKIKAAEEEEQRRIKAEQEAREHKLKLKHDKIAAQKAAHTYMTPSQKAKIKQAQERLGILKKSGYENGIITESTNKINNDIKEILDKNRDSNLRAPIIVVMGHVDTGKTLLLDKIRNTNVQKGEAGGITQQIGSTFISKEILSNKSKIELTNIDIPGLLMIDTPGHEAFINLRSKGSSICDLAIVVIDIVHGLEPQTIESINMLKETNTKIIFALNKIDRLYGWNSVEDNPIQTSLNLNQISYPEFRNRLNDIYYQIMALGINSKLFWENDSFYDNVSICPISAKTGEGITDLLSLVIETSTTCLYEQITYSDNVKCVIFEKTITDGIGSSIDVILINGELKKGDTIMFQTCDGILNTTIREILTPPPNKESRVNSTFIHNDKIKGSIGAKIVAYDLEKAIAGTNIYLQSNNLDSANIESNMKTVNIENYILNENGVIVVASSQGSLDGLMHFLQKECKPPVPVSSTFICNKLLSKDIIKMTFNKKNKKEYSAILAFDVNIVEDALLSAKKNGYEVFNADIIYHLFNHYTEYKNRTIEAQKNTFRSDAVFPCSLKILEKNVYNKKSPMIFGVTITEGNLHNGTPICIPELSLFVGKVISIKSSSGAELTIGKQGTDVCIKVENTENPNIMYGRQFNHTNILFSQISRASIDVIKEYFRDEATTEDLKLIVKLKKMLSII